MTLSLQCKAIRADGLPCQAWARRDSDPPRCQAHAGPRPDSEAAPVETEEPDVTASRRRGFYDRRYTLPEIADLVSQNAVDDLTDELNAARITVRRVLSHLEEALTPSEYAHLAQVIFTGTHTIVRLLQAQKELADPLEQRFYQAIGQALNEMSVNWKADL